MQKNNSFLPIKQSNGHRPTVLPHEKFYCFVVPPVTLSEKVLVIFSKLFQCSAYIYFFFLQLAPFLFCL